MAGLRLTDTGCMYLISMYYKRYELQWRFTLFFAASIIAGGFGGVRPSCHTAHRATLTILYSSSPLPLPKWTVSAATEGGDGSSSLKAS